MFVFVEADPVEWQFWKSDGPGGRIGLEREVDEQVVFHDAIPPAADKGGSRHPIEHAATT